MKIFVTGATGFVGSAVVAELLRAGHDVLGLARSDASTTSLVAAGAEVLRGDLNDLDTLRRGASVCDGAIHTAFIHDFKNYAPAAATDRIAIETIGDVLAGSGRPFVVTSGSAFVAPGRVATEEDSVSVDPNFPRASEPAALAYTARDVRVSVMRLPPSVHGDGDHGFVPALIGIARKKGVSAYVGDGNNRWPAVHRLDAAHLYRLALEGATAGTPLHAIGDEGVPTRDIAEVIGRKLNLPVVSIPAEEAATHFTWLGQFFALDCPAIATLTRQRFDWKPTHATLLADLEDGTYFAKESALR